MYNTIGLKNLPPIIDIFIIFLRQGVMYGNLNKFPKGFRFKLLTSNIKLTLNFI